MTIKKSDQLLVVPEYAADDLGVPFKVVLVDSVKQLIDADTGEVKQVIIPNLRGLIECVAITRILQPRKLSGDEIKFIRKAFKFPAKRIAEMIDVSPEHLSRCEAGERTLSAGAEKCLRASMFIDQIEKLEELNDSCEPDDQMKERLSTVVDAFRKISSIITERKITAAFDPEPLEMRFCVASSVEPGLFKDDPNADWFSNDQSEAIAA